MWDVNTPSAITRVRLLRMSPERVYDELKEYGTPMEPFGDDNWEPMSRGQRVLPRFYQCDDDLEQALYGRSEPLINLGLAQFGASWKIQHALYEQSLPGDSTDAEYGHAIRLAILGNRRLTCDLWMRSLGRSALGDAELLRLAATAGTADSDGLGVLLRNTGARELLSALFNRESPFDQVPLKNLVWMIKVAAQNPCINVDEDSWDGPDLTAWHLQEGIWKLVQMLPANDDTIEPLRELLEAVDPRRVRAPDEDPAPAIARWRTVKLSEGREKWWTRYRCTTLSYAEEFCCIVAALYGHWYRKQGEKLTSMCIGDADSPELFRRCAYYGHGELSAEQMRSAYEKDKHAFTLAVLCNTGIMRSQKKRAVLEEERMLESPSNSEYGNSDNSALWDVYNQRHREFLGVDAATETDGLPTSPEHARGARIEKTLLDLVGDLTTRFKTESGKLWWALALLVAILITVSWHRW